MSRRSSPATLLHTLWARLSPLPGGKWLFSRVFSRIVPYTGSILPLVTTLEAGHAVVEIRDRRRIRNHLDSIHAVALANVGEAASGLAMVGALPPSARGILVGLSVRYRKKARGSLRAECRCTIPEVVEQSPHVVVAHVTDTAGDEVATVEATWMIGPVPEKAGTPG